METILNFLDLLFNGPDIVGLNKAPIPLLALAALGFISGGGLGGIFGGGKRRKEQKDANKAQKRAEADYKNFGWGGNALNNSFGNLNDQYAGLQNHNRGLQVGLQGAQFQQQANDQSFANILDSQVQAGGGAASNATALAREASRANQGISAGIQQQELANQQAVAQQQGNIDELQARSRTRNQELEAQGAQHIQGIKENREYAKFQRTANILNRTDRRKGAADKARQDATNSIFKGLSGAAGAVIPGLGGAGAPPSVNALGAPSGAIPLPTTGPSAPVFLG